VDADSTIISSLLIFCMYLYRYISTEMDNYIKFDFINSNYKI